MTPYLQHPRDNRRLFSGPGRPPMVLSFLLCWALLTPTRAQAQAPPSGKEASRTQKSAGDTTDAREGNEESSTQPPKDNTQPPKDAPHPTFDTQDGTKAAPDKARGWQKEPGVDDDDVALAVPRVILFLPRMALHVVLLPVYGGIALEKEYQLSERVENLMYFDKAHEFGWRPSLSIITNFGTTLGATIFHQSLFGHDEKLTVNAKFGGRYSQLYGVHFKADRLAGTHVWLESVARYQADRAEVFGGIGIVEDGETEEANNPYQSNKKSYFAQERVLGAIRTGYAMGEVGALYKLGGTFIINDRTFNDNTRDKRQTSDVYDTSLIPGYDQGATTLEFQANLILDHRANHGMDARGLYFEAFGGTVPAPTELGFFHYGFEAAYTFDLFHKTRLLTVRTALDAVESETASSVPFANLPRLGGPKRLRGYIEGRFRDTRMALASIEYHYPIHKNIMGELFIDSGYVSDSYKNLYDVRNWKVGGGGGLVVGSDDSVLVNLELAYGEGLQFMLTSDLAHAFYGRSTQL